MFITKEFHFDAAHRLDRLPEAHKCHRLHGHTYVVWITVKGVMNEDLGWVQDYADISAVVDPLIKEKFDHHYLNETLPWVTTAENIAKYLYITLKGKLNVHSVEVQEGLRNKVRFCPSDQQ